MDNPTWISLLPPVVAIVLVILTKKVVLSLGAGVLSAAAIVAGFNPIETLRLTWDAFLQIFWVDGELNTYYIFILVFTLTLGMITSLILMSGGSQAFSDWAITKIRSRRGSQGLAAGLGLAIFIDDYFNALAVGQVARPVTDRHQVARAKLAYLIDSTSAPVAVLAPFSSWGASIIGIMAPVVAASALAMSDVQAFLGAAGTNYYAMAAILTVLLVVALQLDFGPMRKEERRAVEEGLPYEPGQDIPGELSEDLPIHEPGAMRALIVPFVALVAGVIGGIVWTGYTGGDPRSWAPLDILANTDVTEALLYGGALGFGTALYYYARYTKENPRFGPATLGRGLLEGLKSMLPAVYILLLAWALGSLISQLGTGDYLGGLVEAANIAPQWLVPVMFLIAGVMAFSTGTSWGSFGILIPIAGDIMNSLGATEQLLPAMGAVLAGAVFGDHCSPISDTTILSSTGASCNVITHVTTQLPYAILGAAGALIGYIVLALTGSALVGFGAMVVTVTAAVLLLRRVNPVLTRVSARASTNA
ncbi:MAG: Na+/H+ antiporter NhaC family protein [Dermatophilaceae bacterium]|nr:Na+/H+ antiporter NhaC family protein [Intrasporangiaceae bacterium]